MLDLNAQHIRMHRSAPDKPAALRQLAEVLVADGLVAEGYLDGLRAREAQGSTYLGQGIAIPHGTPETRELVHDTGVRLLHFPEGVDWGEGRSSTWRSASPPARTSTCACSSCSPGRSARTT